MASDYVKNPRDQWGSLTPELHPRAKEVQKTPAQIMEQLVNALIYRGVGFNNHEAFFKELTNQVVGTRNNYPPFDIIGEEEDKYQIRIALAGFSREDVDITFQNQVLTVEGKQEEESEDKFFHKGIAARNFTQRFPLAEYVSVTGAEMKDGILTVYLERELPAALKAKSIKIK